ncbi:VWA domain-containing protein [Halalkalibacter urbisdiaboli]|uniref:VWA domain-containing protein n=1 Tax=Halalkalibacter urbisdiaboli TaxID=1960589 RepID=UPI000B44C5B6|nr:VWA domain-containing protein [Halalkalibacter urbisdiaboli]
MLHSVGFKLKALFLSTLLIIFLVGCNQENSEKIHNEPESLVERELDIEEPRQVNEIKNQKDLSSFVEIGSPIIPTTLEEVLDFPGGSFSGERFDKNNEPLIKELKQLPTLDENSSDEEVEQYLYNLLLLYAEDYPDPTALVNRWEQLSFGSPEVEDPRYEVKENFNVEIILDSSGSMKEEIDGRQKLDVAKEAIKEFMKQLPEEANVALRVYGHIGESEEVSCKRADRVYDLQPYHEADFTETLEEFYPNGWTPIAYALEQTKKDFAELKGENNTNVIYLVSDGIETCNGDPVQVAKELGESEITPIVNVIGFDVPSDEQQQLKDMAKAAKGVYASAKSQEQLKEELNRTNEMALKWSEWRNKSQLSITHTKNIQSLELHDEYNLWKKKKTLEAQNIFFTVTYLSQNTDKLPSEVQKKLKRIMDERERAIEVIGEKVYKKLQEDNEKSFSQLREEIDNLFNANVENN